MEQKRGEGNKNVKTGKGQVRSRGGCLKMVMGGGGEWNVLTNYDVYIYINLLKQKRTIAIIATK